MCEARRALHNKEESVVRGIEQNDGQTSAYYKVEISFYIVDFYIAEILLYAMHIWFIRKCMLYLQCRSYILYRLHHAIGDVQIVN